MISLGFEDTIDAPGVPELVARLDLVKATALSITIGRPDWVCFPWEGHERAYAEGLEPGRDYVAETIAAIGGGRRITAVIDVMAQRWIEQWDASVAGIAADGTASTEFASLTALTDGPVGAAILDLVTEACMRWSPAAIGLTELFFDGFTFGPDDRASYLRFAAAEDWPRTYAKTIDETHPSIGAWRSDAVTRFVARVAERAAQHGATLDVEVRAQWDGPTNAVGQDYAALLGVADRLIVWAYFALARKEPAAVEGLVRSLGDDLARYVISIGMWSPSGVLTTAQLRRGVEASLRGGAVASTVVPASLIDQSHWRELRVLWNPPR